MSTKVNDTYSKCISIISHAYSKPREKMKQNVMRDCFMQFIDLLLSLQVNIWRAGLGIGVELITEGSSVGA